MSGNERKEYGDYQTPVDFCKKVCDYLKRHGFVEGLHTVFEPTCGVGNFLSAAAMSFDCRKLMGVEINEQYARIAQRKVPQATVMVGNIFEIDPRSLCGEENVLILGNPPWATNAELLHNLPEKVNFRGLRGIEAMTGSSNFDICEYVILKLLEQCAGMDSTLCMLCKTTVARNVVVEIARNGLSCQSIEILHFDSRKVFGVFASACVFIVRLSPHPVTSRSTVCQVKDFESESHIDTLTVSEGRLKSAAVQVDLEGVCPLTWRQGVKHDCGQVMELERRGGVWVNKRRETTVVEDDLVFPLVKSSHFKSPIMTQFSKGVLVTQRNPGQDTAYIEKQFPLAWAYLTKHTDDFSGRKSKIYRNKPPFSMFGVGEYSFAPYKVGLSGFYKKPLFCLLHGDKPVMTDDTAYFLPFEEYDAAYCMMLLLNSEVVQEFLTSIAFLDNKRPYTVKLLSRLDLRKCLQAVSLDMMMQTERALSLASYVTEKRYQKLMAFVESHGRNSS